MFFQHCLKQSKSSGVQLGNTPQQNRNSGTKGPANSAISETAEDEVPKINGELTKVTADRDQEADARAEEDPEEFTRAGEHSTAKAGDRGIWR